MYPVEDSLITPVLEFNAINPDDIILLPQFGQSEEYDDRLKAAGITPLDILVS